MSDQQDWNIHPDESPPAAAEQVDPMRGPRWTSLLALFAFLLALRYVVPYLAEEVSYSITRGKERAAHQAGTAMLAKSPFGEQSAAYQAIAKRVSPSVVHIKVHSVSRDRIGDGVPYLRQHESEGQGSGVIMDSDGYIVTNYHVLRNAVGIEVSLSDGRKVEAQVIGADSLTDIALIKVEASGLIAAEWGDSERLEVGSLVWALGSPFGLRSTFTFGILSAKNRGTMAGGTMAGNHFQNFLQTDAAVNPGNSGGPLVDEHGNVIGINTAIIGQAYQGIGFAVPSSIAKQTYNRLRTEGKVERGWLGVEMETVTKELADRLGVEPTGAFVVAVVSGLDVPTPARVAGVSPGDIIVRWNDTPIAKSTDLSRAVAAAHVGSTADVHIIRDQVPMVLSIQVGSRPNLRP